MALTAIAVDSNSSAGGATTFTCTLNRCSGTPVTETRRLWIFAVFTRSANLTPVKISGYTAGAIGTPQTMSLTGTRILEKVIDNGGLDGHAECLTIFAFRNSDFPSTPPTANGTALPVIITLDAVPKSHAFSGICWCDADVNSGVDADISQATPSYASILYQESVAVGSPIVLTVTPATDAPQAATNWDRNEGVSYDDGNRGVSVQFCCSNRYKVSLMMSTPTGWSSASAVGTDGAGTDTDNWLETNYESGTGKVTSPTAAYTVTSLTSANTMSVQSAYVHFSWLEPITGVSSLTRRAPRRSQLVSTLAAQTDLKAAILALSPKHYWPMTELSGTLTDVGSTPISLAFAGAGTVNYVSRGPVRPANYGIFVLSSATGNFRATASAANIANQSTGTVMAFVSPAMNSGAANRNVLLGLADSTTAGKNGIHFGVGVDGLGTAGRLSINFWGATASVDRRTYSDTAATLPAPTGRPTYRLLCWTFDGVSAPVGYVDGVAVTWAAPTTAGTPPAASTNFSTFSLANLWVASQDYTSAAADDTKLVAHVAIWDGVILTPAQMQVIAALRNS